MQVKFLVSIFTLSLFIPSIIETTVYAGDYIFQNNPQFKIIDAKEARKNNPFTIVHDKPMSENEVLIPQLIATANNLPPSYLYELARRLWLTDKSGAFEWLAVGMVRAKYDALRCVDTTSRQGIQFLPLIAPDVIKGIEENRKLFGEAGLRAMSRSDLFVDSISPSWICTHGMGAINAALQGKQLSENEWLRPTADWKGIQNEIRNDMTQYFIEQGKPQNDPIEMTKRHIFKLTVPAPFNNSYAWFDNDHLVVSHPEKDSNGTYIQHLAMFDMSGKLKEFTTTQGIWCSGNKNISFQSAIEKIEGNLHRITFSAGQPEHLSSFTIDLHRPFQNASRIQDFAQSWSLPANSIHQSPFDCRWEENATLSGNKNTIQWFPLLPGDGSIQFDAPNSIQWITKKGDSKKLPISGSITQSSFHYLAWKRAYLVAPTWSRFWNKEKNLPACIPAAIIYPDKMNIEETCIPFDINNTYTPTATMFSLSPKGWLHATSSRNTAHGQKTGGIYLFPKNGKPEKLIEASILNWSISPDGCNIAFHHRPISTNNTVELQVLNLCKIIDQKNKAK